MKKKIKILALSMISGFSVLAFATSSIAWFASGVHVAFGDDPSNVNITGGSEAAYYKGGSGTEQDPFILANKVHVYNLSWLQYIGYYNKRSTIAANSPIELEQCYFVVEDDIDMGGLTIPPIGTNKYPFLGHFDGQGNTISNFIISNDNPANDESDFGVAKPANLYQGTQPDIVGFFGVMGKLPNQTISETYDPDIVGASNIVLEDFTVVSKTSQVLIGLAGGYVNGDLSGVKVGDNAKIDVNGQVSTAKTNITSNLSDYGLIGYSTRLDNSGGTYVQELSKMDANYDTSQPEGGGQGDDWGGSIDMFALNERVYTLLNKDLDSGSLSGTDSNDSYLNSNFVDTLVSNKGVQTKYHHFYNDTYNKINCGHNVGWNDQAYSPSDANWGSRKNFLKTDPKTAPITYRFETGTPVYNYNNPANVGTNTSRNIKIKVPNTILPILVDDSNNYRTSVSNTGYIVGGMSGSGSYNAQTSVRSASYAISNINGSYDGSNLNIYTLSNPATTSSSFSLVAANNTFKKYTGALSQLEDTLTNSPNYVHGLHFSGSDVDKDKVVEVESGYINKKAISNYEVPESSVNFNVKEKGYINFFAGAYITSGNTIDSFFGLYVVVRDNNSHITDIKEIKEIWENSDSSTNGDNPYYYVYSDNATSSIGTKGSNKLFDLTNLWTAEGNTNKIYYFEIPVNPGEYAMGSHNGKKNGTYLIYLDIGTSGEIKDKVDAHYITTNKSGVAHPIGVDFNVNDSGVNGGDSFGFAIASSNRGTVVVAISTTTDENDTVAVTQSSAIAVYSYRKTNYQNSFSITGMSGNPPSGNSEKVRVITINLKTTGDVRYNIVITETLGANDVVTEAIYSVNDEISASYDTDAEIEALSNEIVDIDAFRALPVVATLTRSYGTAEFYTEYNITKCTDTVVDVTIALNSTRITAAVTNGYTLKVNDATISNGQTITQ